MKSIIAAVVTCAILFGVSFAASNYFAQLEPTEIEEPETQAEEKADQESTLPPDAKQVNKVPVMQVAHRPSNAVSLEAVLQMSQSIKKMEEKLIIREQRVAKDEARIRGLFSDLSTEQDELQAFAEGVDSKVRALERMTDELRNTLAVIDSRKAELVALEKKVGVDEDSQQDRIDSKVNDVKSWFSNLEAEQASDYLKDFANKGKLEFAASLLHKMPDRQKSKILGALNDPILVSQMIEALKVKPKESN